jgi:hypothetical protein
VHQRRSNQVGDSKVVRLEYNRADYQLIAGYLAGCNSSWYSMHTQSEGETN